MMENSSFSPVGDDKKAEDGSQVAAAEASDVAPAAPVLTDQEREQLTEELKKTEDEIATLRTVLQARLKHANELKRKLSLTPWTEFQHDVAEGLKNVKETAAFQKTTEFVSHTSGAITNKLGQIRDSNALKSFEAACTNVKAKIISSTSIDQLYGGQATAESNEATHVDPPLNSAQPAAPEPKTSVP